MNYKLFVFLILLMSFGCSTELIKLSTINSPETSTLVLANQKSLNCNYLYSKSIFYLFFVLPLNSKPTETFLPKNSQQTVVRYSKVMDGSDVLFTLLGFLFSVIVTTDKYEVCSGNFTRTLVEDLPVLNIAKGPSILSSIAFSFGSSSITTTESLKIENMAKSFLKVDPNIRILLIGTADSIGDTASNLKLANNRVISAKELFKNQGIPEKNIQTMTQVESDQGWFSEAGVRGVLVFIVK